MATPADPAAHPERPPLRRGHAARWTLGTLGVAAALGLGFWAYLQPGMMLNWETVAALCGF